MTEDGQISIDLLVGISIFLLTLSFMIQFVPGLFMSMSGEGSLNSVAYRTATILAEDPGWWENNTNNGTDWEIHTGNIGRLGLAVDDTPLTRETQTPNMLNKKKILEILKLNETVLTAKLGLFDKISGSQIDYGYNITIEQNESPMVINGSNISFGKMPPASQDIFKAERLMLIETGGIAEYRFDELTSKHLENDKVNINISGPQSMDVIIQITDLNISNPNAAKFNWAKLNGTMLEISSNYTAFKRTNTSGFIYSTTPIDLKNSTDTLRLILNHTLFQANTTYQLELKFIQMNLILEGPPYIEYTPRAEPLYEPAILVVKVWG